MKKEKVGIKKDKNLKKYLKWEMDMLKTYGWYVHIVQLETNPNLANAHTHGIFESFGHLDFQIALSLPKNVYSYIFAELVERINDDKIFTDGMIVDDLLEKYNVKFLKYTESGRDVMRIIIPDRKGNLDRFTSEEPFNMQYDDFEKVLV